jgi:hypothetical protein
MKKFVRQITKNNVKNLFVALVAVSLLGCSDSDKDVNVQSISLNKTSVTLDPGQSEQLIATVEPGDATNKRVLWTSQNEAIATVVSDGTVEAKTPGETKIIATSAENETIKAEATVKVNNVDLALELAGTYHGQVTMNDAVADPDVEMTLTRTGFNALNFLGSATIMNLPLTMNGTLAVNGNSAITGTGITNDFGWGPKDVEVTGGSFADGILTLNLDVDSITETVVFTGTK